MYVQNLARGNTLRGAFGASVLAISGCGGSLPLGDAGGPRSTLSLSVIQLSADSTYIEANPNDFLESAEFVDIVEAPAAIQGRVESGGDVDVYDLGPVLAGDRILVNMTADNTLTGVLALFDADGTALLVNDHRNAYLGVVDPFIDVVATHDSDSCYVAVSATPGFDASGGYTLIAGKESAVAVPLPRPDTFLLVFNGGNNVRIGRRSPINVPPFDAADISPDYTGQTALMIDELVARVREDYAGTDVTILSTSEGATYSNGMSRVFFGTFDPALLGVAEGVDEFNGTRDQEAIVFTDTFSAFVKLGPSARQMSQALANVVSHEIGHLLGLVHTTDADGIMDVTASLRELMRDQLFTRSPLYSAVFPLGFQDAPRYLSNTVGGSTASGLLPALLAGREAFKLFDGDLTPARSRRPLSSCCLP